MLWANVGLTYIGMPDDGGIIVADSNDPADMSGVRCYVIGRDFDAQLVGCWTLVAVREDASVLEVARDLADNPDEAIENLMRIAHEHDQGVLRI